MKKWIPALGSVAVTLAAVAIAAVVVLNLWDYYMKEPWTRDGRVHANVIQIAPDVSGLVTEVKVSDNQKVSRGQTLLVIDRARFELAVQEAEAMVKERRAQLEQARREARRNVALKGLVATETIEVGDTMVKRAEAALGTAEAALGTARLNLERTNVITPVDGYVSDRVVRVGLPGMADAGAIVRVRITPDMVGKEVGIAVQAEYKTATGRQAEDQRTWADAVRRAGGVYELVRSADQMVDLVDRVRRGSW